MKRSNWVIITLTFVVLVVTGYAIKNNFDAKIKAYSSVSNDVVREEDRVMTDLLAGLRTGGDSYSEAVRIADCNRESRTRFDELLSNLATLKQPEIIELDKLFNSCAYYYATVQTVSVARLERELEMYREALRIAAVLDPAAEAKLNNLTTWDDIISKEKERGMLHNKLVVIQGQIVDEFLNYKRVEHPDVQALVAEANEARENIVFLTQQIDELAAAVNGS